MAREFQLSFRRLDGGVNYSLPPDLIADNELEDSLNFIYASLSGRLTTRNGVTRYSQSPTGNPVNGLFYSTVLDLWLLASGGTLYYLDGSFVPQSIGALNGSGRPCFLDFNGKVLVASGGTLQSTNGTTLSDVSGAPQCSKIMLKDGRVFAAGSGTYPHRVFGSGPGDETDWDSVAGNAVYFDVDLNSGSYITDFNVFLNDIVVFKGPDQKGIYRIIVPEGDYTKAYIKQDSSASYSINWHTSISVNNNLYFLDSNGWKSLKGVVSYGDIEQDPAGFKVDRVMAPEIDVSNAFMFHYPALNQIWIVHNPSMNHFVFHYLQNGGKGAFLPVSFAGVSPVAAHYSEQDGKLFLGMDDGYIYYMDATSYRDAGSDYPKWFKSKRMAIGGTTVIKKLVRTVMSLEVLAEHDFSLTAQINRSTQTVAIGSGTTRSGDVLIYNAGTYIHDADNYLFYSMVQSYLLRKMVWHTDLQYLLAVYGGGATLNDLEGSVVVWGRRQR